MSEIDEDSNLDSLTVRNINNSQKRQLIMEEPGSDDQASPADNKGAPPNDGDSDDDIPYSRTKKRVQILSDNSDDEPEHNERMESPFPEHPNSLINSLIEFDHKSSSEDDQDLEATKSERYKKLRILCDDESSPEEKEDEVEHNKKAQKVRKAVRQKKEKKNKSNKDKSPQEDTESSESGVSEDEEKPQKKRKAKKVEKPKKITKQQKEEEMAKRNEVYSMIQKNAREEIIEVPYHKPEQYNLKEFLSHLQMSKTSLPTDEKLAKRTGKLRALKVERKIVVQEENDLQKEKIESVEQIPSSEEQVPLPESPDEIDMLISGPSTEDTAENTKNLLPEQTKGLVGNKLILHGTPETLIDLESGIVHEKPKSKEICLIEKCISQNAKTTVETIRIENAPGVAYKILKENLEQELLRKKREQMQKYLDEQEREKITKIANEIDDEAEFADSDTEECENIEDLKDNDQDPEVVEEDGEAINDKEDNEAEEDDVEENGDVEADEEDNEAEDEDSDDELEPMDRKKKFHKRIVNMNDEDSEDEGKEDEFPIPNDCIQLPTIEDNPLVSESQMEKDEMELFDLCTGNFVTQPPPMNLEVHEDPAECEDTQQNDIQTAPNFESSDEENSPTKISKKKIPRVYLSDNEEEGEKEIPVLEDSNDELPEPPELSDQEEDVDEGDDGGIAYDSEENEVDVPTIKPKMRATDFVDNEAELSESDWGSADEDEKDLDKLDLELGDEDHFDQAQLQSELERIHMKKLLDQDAREVKMVKNLVLHEEEREGMLRERTFRWLHVENDFTLEPGQENDEARQSDEENEEVWRKIRHERDVVLKEKLQGDLPGMFDMQNVTILKPNIPEDPTEGKAATFLVPERNNLSRKSLLLQDDEYLSRLATIASKTSDILVGGATEKGGFVFRQVMKQDASVEITGKRKLDNPAALIKGKKRKKTSIYG